MKKSLLYTAIALATLAGTTSCGDDFLVLDPVGSVSKGTLTTTDGIDYVLTGAYSTLNGMLAAHWMGAASLSNYVFGDVLGNDANKGSQSTDQSDFTQIECHQFTSGNSYIKGKWSAVYEAAKRCNNVIELCDQLGEENYADYKTTVAQARFLKGLWMFEGIKNFGAAIPYVTVEQYEESTDPQVSNVDESGNYVYIWQEVAEDLRYAYDNLPETWTSTGDYGRATKAAAAAMLGKLFLYWSSPYNGTNATADHWKDAADMFDYVINSGTDAKGNRFALAPDYGQLFDVETSDWNGETVFDCQMTISGSQYYTNTISYTQALGIIGGVYGGWGFYQPTYEFVNAFAVDQSTGLPVDDYLGLTTSGVARPQATTDGKTVDSHLDVFTDPRVDYSVGRFGVPFLDWGTPEAVGSWVRSYSNGGLYLNKKNQPKNSDRGSTSLTSYAVSSAKNFHVIRYADVLLMRAECYIHDGNLPKATELINEVRARAAKNWVKNDPDDWETGSYVMIDKTSGTQTISTGAAANYCIGLYDTFTSADQATKALRRERRLELGMEGHHWYDECRWGIVGDEKGKFVAFENNYINKYQNYDSNWVCLPIPYDEIQTAEGRFVQNENWK